MATPTASLAQRLPWAPAAAAEADWDALYTEQLPKVLNFFRYRVGDEGLAEDLASVTFEKAWRARDRYRRDLAGFATWLMAIARNVAVDHFRRARHGRHAPLEAAEAVPVGEDPLEQASRRSAAERLRGLLDGLSEREQELVAMKYGAGLSHREIARLSGLSESNVGTVLHRTVQKLREAWGEESGA